MAETASNGEIAYRVLGRTRERVSAIGVGGWHPGLKNVEERTPSCRLADRPFDIQTGRAGAGLRPY
jgi:hypothetical protein